MRRGSTFAFKAMIRLVRNGAKQHTLNLGDTNDGSCFPATSRVTRLDIGITYVGVSALQCLL